MIENLAEHPEYWSDSGKVLFEPRVQDAAKVIKQTKQQVEQQTKQTQQGVKK
jgi:hypothetical protein